jgi:hypothetical protein
VELQKKIAGSLRARGVSESGLWRLMVTGEVDAERLVFVDEMGTNVSLSPLSLCVCMAGRARESEPSR